MSYPWERYGGSFVWRDSDTQVHVTLPTPCCDRMDAERIGDCGRGCCDDYRCRSCGRTWRYEYPD